MERRNGMEVTHGRPVGRMVGGFTRSGRSLDRDIPPTERICDCGTKISRYNGGNQCHHCQRETQAARARASALGKVDLG